MRTQAVATSTIAVFQLIDDVRIFGKQPTGGVDPFSRYFLFPYLWVYRRIVDAHRLVIRHEPVATMIAPGWYIAGWMDKVEHVYPNMSNSNPVTTTTASSPISASSNSNNNNIASTSISSPKQNLVAILDLTCELPRRIYDPSHISSYLCIPTFDRAAPPPADIQRGVEFSLAQRKAGNDVVVHCAFGHGRSATCLLACLLAEGHYQTIEEGENAMRALRPLIYLSEIQRHMLEGWCATYLPAHQQQQQQQQKKNT